MSKSYNNTIPIFETPKKLRKLVMSIQTDSTPMESPKVPETCAIYQLFKLFATPDQQAALADRYRAGGMGYGEAKETLYQAAMAHFGEAFERRTRLESSPSEVEDILKQGARRARAKAVEVLERVRSACGLSARPA
jgi:tryptophanyl-tRNA synthetase